MNRLPTETLLNIFASSCTSQESYLAHLLVNRHFYTVVKYEALQTIPVRVNARNVRSFRHFVSELGMAVYIKFLWINAGHTQATLVVEVLQSCKGLQALACAMSTFVKLCRPPKEIDATEPTAKHTHTALAELTLFGSLGLWNDLAHSEYPTYARMLCAQITHLRVHDMLSVDFALISDSDTGSESDANSNSGNDRPQKRPFYCIELPNLTHIGISLPLFGRMAAIDPRAAVWGLLQQLAGLEKVERIVASAYHWKREDPPNKMTLKVLGMDSRLQLVFLGDGLDEFGMWCARARGEGGIWEVEASGKSIV